MHQCDQQKTPYGFPIVVLHVFYRQSVLVILQKIEATYILTHTINTNTQGEGSSKLIVLLGFSCFLKTYVFGASFGT